MSVSTEMGEAMQSIAESMGISKEGVFSAMTEKAKADAVFYGIFCIFCAAFVWVAAAYIIYLLKVDEDGDSRFESFSREQCYAHLAMTLCLSIIGFGLAIAFFFALNYAISCAMSPEAEAIKKIVDLARKLNEPYTGGR